MTPDELARLRAVGPKPIAQLITPMIIKISLWSFVVGFAIGVAWTTWLLT